ncbi:PREDICTED: uncharacterized protein LOC104824599 [Tarenaya hassleriana]|uniref:uncharacterized protein LOC104824599 n=1 Tax=Tarenaya hassleriana TaxID=28532 RepID=UPI00053C5256|nr:PREDICTED: uncharacterized protein LOC104824599 [Tarenaya hassleriana]
MAEEKPRRDPPKGKKNPFSRIENTSSAASTMRKSWSTDSLALMSNSSRLGKAPCICAPTKHEGSFRCRLHRSSAGTSSSSSSSHGQALAAPPHPLLTQLHLPKSLLSSRVE